MSKERQDKNGQINRLKNDISNPRKVGSWKYICLGRKESF